MPSFLLSVCSPFSAGEESQAGTICKQEQSRLHLKLNLVSHNRRGKTMKRKKSEKENCIFFPFPPQRLADIASALETEAEVENDAGSSKKALCAVPNLDF